MSRARRVGGWIVGLMLVASTSLMLWNGFKKSAEQLEDEGRTSLNRRDAAGALLLLEQAVIAEPERLSAWKLLADAASRTGQVDRSIEALKVVARIAPDDANSLCLQLSGRWMANNRIQPAIRTLKIAIAADPKPPQLTYD
jgi:cytochrome c-type biogenesis protein CcmH/NrfG